MNFSNEIVQCTRCVMDTDNTQLMFDNKGVCHLCRIQDEFEIQFPQGEAGQNILEKKFDHIRSAGKGKDYDCVAGISGGTDSTYILYMLKQYGIRPLAVHFDNGWNSEIAVRNIKRTLDKLKIDLYTYVIDWEEMKDIQLSFLKASVPEVEVPTDWAIMKVVNDAAIKENVQYVISGHNFREEGVIPQSWIYRDGKYIRSVHKLFGKKKMSSFPNLRTWDLISQKFISRVEKVKPLNYFDYDKSKAKDLIKKEFNWVDYGGHHFESVYTRFYQGYIAPVKFHHDRRKVVLSSHVRQHKISRAQALHALGLPTDYTTQQANDDAEYIAKKFDLTLDEFQQILAAPPKTFREYPTNYAMYNMAKRFIKRFNLHFLFPEKKATV